MTLRSRVFAVAGFAFVCLSLGGTSYAQTCDPSVMHEIRRTGKGAQMAAVDVVMARLKRIENQVGPEVWSRVAKDTIDVFDPNLGGSAKLTIHDWVELSKQGTDSEIAAVIKAVDMLRDGDNNLILGIVVKSKAGDGSTRWMLTAKSGNRGYLFEVVGARNLIQEGFVDPTRIAGMGLRILDANGDLLVEGDLVEYLFSGGLRYIDFKAAGGHYSLPGLERAKQALLNGEIDEMIYAYEAGTVVPDDWLAAFNAANRVLEERLKTKMVLKSAGAFK